MKTLQILFDQNIPHNWRTHLSAHFVKTSPELGWEELENGDLWMPLSPQASIC